MPYRTSYSGAPRSDGLARKGRVAKIEAMLELFIASTHRKKMPPAPDGLELNTCGLRRLESSSDSLAFRLEIFDREPAIRPGPRARMDRGNKLR